MKKGKRGFTLIELIIVLVIVGILAAIAIPKFKDISQRAKFASVKGTCGNVRSALSISKANNLITDVNSAINYWATGAELQLSEVPATITNPACPVDSVMPTEPFRGANTIASVSTTVAIARTVAGTDGWNYCETNGIFFANTSVANADDGMTANQY